MTRSTLTGGPRRGPRLGVDPQRGPSARASVGGRPSAGALRVDAAKGPNRAMGPRAAPRARVESRLIIVPPIRGGLKPAAPHSEVRASCGLAIVHPIYDRRSRRTPSHETCMARADLNHPSECPREARVLRSVEGWNSFHPGVQDEPLRTFGMRNSFLIAGMLMG